MVAFTLVMATIAAGVAIAQGIKETINELKPDKEADLKEVRYLTYDDGQKKGGFRLIIANEKTGWSKAVRVYTQPGSNDWKEVKAGDDTGKVAKSNSHIKYDSLRVDWPSNQEYITLNIMKPGFMGVWSTVDEISISKSSFLKDYDGKTIVFYYNNDNSKYFNNDNNIIVPSDF